MAFKQFAKITFYFIGKTNNFYKGELETMKLVAADKKALRFGYKQTKLYDLLEEFRDSGLDCVEVTEYHHKNAKSCYSCLTNSIRRFRMPIKAHIEDDKVFLMRIV